MNQIFKYPRTPHLRGSRLQPGDEDLRDIPFSEIAGKHLIVEEKMDGSNCGISFSETGDLRLQSRGHYLSGGPRERQWDLFKSWANAFAEPMREVLGTSYVMYGEWMYAKHTVFYNALQHYFLEFDVLDLESGLFLDAVARREMRTKLPFVHSVPVLFEGQLTSQDELIRLIGPSTAIENGHLEDLKQAASKLGLREELTLAATDTSLTMEGLYVKVEAKGQVLERYKYVRGTFSQMVDAAMEHWMDRPLIPNKLAEDVDIFVY